LIVVDAGQGFGAALGLTFKSAFTVGSTAMMDVVMLAIGVIFFALSIAYVYACDLL
jgi:hypothetical protein